MYTEKEDDQPSVFDEWLEHYFVDPNTSFLDFQAFRMDLFECNTHYLLEAIFEKKRITHITISTDKNNLTILATSVHGEQQQPIILERSISFPFSLKGRNISAELSTDAALISISKETNKKGTSSILNFEVPSHCFNS